ncbi:hypothetical protein TEA_012496 [Camellia sinensis var. sinensis]|uniref:Uncharacterized protein n=1 Tax=Camellia sinensis var. sinensis TaxID=542762 RepID=A0A4S4F066_CAMSN|nr:hypothetical protein TEA_012496 [Camellia sinensis var. sinensis]
MINSPPRSSSTWAQPAVERLVQQWCWAGQSYETEPIGRAEDRLSPYKDIQMDQPISMNDPDEADLIDRNDQQQFLASADFLSNYGMPTLISNMQAAASEVLKGKQLKDLFNTTVLHETTVQILDMFMSMGSPHHWVEYLMPEDPNFYKLVAFSNSDSTDPSDSTKFDRLMVETRAVLSSAEFGNMVDVSLNTAVDALMEDIKAHLGEGNSLPGIPLAKLLPRLAQISPLLLEEPSKNRDGYGRRGGRASPVAPEPEAFEEHSVEDTRKSSDESNNDRDTGVNPKIFEDSETTSEMEASPPQKRMKKASY